MFVRAKILRGRTYYQLVQSHREGATTSQESVASLGTTDDPAVALKRLKAELKRYVALRAELPRKPIRKVAAREAKRLDAQIARLQPRIKTLQDVIQTGAIKK
jgi:hypothetical protein